MTTDNRPYNQLWLPRVLCFGALLLALVLWLATS